MFVNNVSISRTGEESQVVLRKGTKRRKGLSQLICQSPKIRSVCGSIKTRLKTYYLTK